MSFDKDSQDTEQCPPVERPPAIRERLWNLIPEGERALYRKEAARGLRKGIHPETTIIGMLVRAGWDPDRIDAMMRPVRHRDENDDGQEWHEAQEAPTRASVAAAEAPSSSERILRAPHWPFGSSGYRRGDVPRCDIGEIIHYECGYDAPTACEMEWLILRAVARDPAFVAKDVAHLRLLGCDLPSDVLPPVRNAVVFECECVIDDIRRRQAAGDIAAMAWIDPDSLIF